MLEKLSYIFICISVIFNRILIFLKIIYNSGNLQKSQKFYQSLWTYEIFTNPLKKDATKFKISPLVSEFLLRIQDESQ
jgi:hypothetical protein